MKNTNYAITLFLLMLICVGGCKQEIEKIITPPEIPEENKEVPDTPVIDFSKPEFFYKRTMTEDIPEVDCLPDMIEGKEEDITGKWKLLKIDINYGVPWRDNSFDYSCDSIIYEFTEKARYDEHLPYLPEQLSPIIHTSGTLRVRGEIREDIQLFQQGEYTYHFRGNLIGHPLMMDWGNLKIDDDRYSCTVMNSLMRLGDQPYIMLFVRIE